LAELKTGGVQRVDTAEAVLEANKALLPVWLHTGSNLSQTLPASPLDSPLVRRALLA